MAMKPPRIAGRALAAVRVVAETPGAEAAIREIMRRGLGLDVLPGLPRELRGDLRNDARPLSARREHARHDAKLGSPAPGAWPRTSAAFTEAYRARKVTPREVAERALAAIASLSSRSPTMNILASSDRERTLREAAAATARYLEGRPIGPLDGVPVLIKDEFDVAGLVTTLGSRCEEATPKTSDSAVVARLTRAGAVFACKTVLTEWGMSPIGANVSSIAPMPHNAHDPTRAPGGSSSGSGVGVAMGAAPLAAGGDGGGSIRIPSSLNGVFGIKPTFGRVSRAGDGFKGSVAHAGPLASCPADLAHFLDAVSTQHDEHDELTAWAPPVRAGGFASLLGAGVRGLRIGVDEDEWRDANDEVAKAGKAALAALEKEGAELVSVSLPLAHHAAKIGYLTIGPESVAFHMFDLATKKDLIGDDVRLAFAILSRFTAVEQLDAQRLRTGLREELQRMLRDVDVIALPTTAITAPRYTEEDARTSFSDPVALDGLCRFAFLGNLTGLPAGTAPVGLDGAGLPIGLQIVGDAWDEPTVLGVLAHLERIGAAEARKPAGAIDLLG